VYDISFSESSGRAIAMSIFMPSGEHAKQSLPCVFMIPASGALLEGTSVSEIDMQKRACGDVWLGGAVFETSMWPPNARQSKLELGERICDERLRAIDRAERDHYVTARVPWVDRIAVCLRRTRGRRAALYLAAMEPRIKGCVTLSPVCDVAAHLGEPVTTSSSN